MSFYNYIIGRIYSWGLRRENDTPIANVVFTMCIVHYFQLFTVYMILRKVFNFQDFLLEVNKFYIGVLLIAFFVVYYLLFYRREMWERYAREVEMEDERKRKRGKLFVLLYLIGSILLFFLSLPFVFG